MRVPRMAVQGVRLAGTECRRQPEAHFLLPKTGARLSFACLPK